MDTQGDPKPGLTTPVSDVGLCKALSGMAEAGAGLEARHDVWSGDGSKEVVPLKKQELSLKGYRSTASISGLI